MAILLFQSKPILVFLILISILTSQVLCESESEANECDEETGDCIDKKAALRLKIIAIISILGTSMIGVCLPLFTTKIPSLKPDGNIFVVVKSFASGIIFGTGMMHVLPDAAEQLSSSCLPENPWHIFPVADYVAGIAAIFTLTLDAICNSVFSQKHQDKENFERRNGGDSEAAVEVKGGLHFHSHGGSQELEKETEGTQLVRYRVIAMVLEIGIVVHSVVIGLSLGASNNKCTIRPLIAALCFHQMFEGMGLGGSILQAQYKMSKRAIMVFFFSITTPLGIVIGLAVSKIYKENSPTALMAVGMFDALSAGLLIYMALVELLGADFMGRKLQSNRKLIFMSAVAATLGFTGMAILAKWA